MTKVENPEEYEDVISSYYEGRGVSSIISFKVDTKKSDNIAEKLSEYQNIEDISLVTGDVDLVVKARFKNYDHMKNFLTDEASHLDGVQDLTSMMIVTTYKENGKLIEASFEEDEEED
ncbi:MAG: Lrp/AsnC family transcriptional regulator [Thermoplasmatota archaeon]